MINGFMYITICNSDDTVKLSANYNFLKNEYHSCCLTFGNCIWDNDDYLFEEFYPFLNRYKNRVLLKEDLELVIGLKDDISEEWVNDLLEIFNQAIKMNLWKKFNL